MSRYNILPIIAFLFCLCAPGPLAAQRHDHDDHDDHDHHGLNEFGLSVGPIYALDDKAWGSGVHLHYYRTLGAHSKWAVGGMVEYAWVRGSHLTLGAGVKFEPFRRFCIGVLPGVTFLPHHDHDEDGEHDDLGRKAAFSTHFEVVYDLFHWERFHLGPVFDYSWAKKDSHVMLGIHAAYCF